MSEHSHVTLLRRLGLRVASAVVTLFAVSVIIFIGIQLLPGNAAIAALGVNEANQTAVRADEQAFGLEQALDWYTRDEAGGLDDMPYPPDYPKMAGEPKRVQPSRAKKED